MENLRQPLQLFVLQIDILPPRTLAGIAGDSKDHSLGFLFPRLDLFGGISPPKQRSISPEA
ncbi:MAG TPA: hypothetical protein IGS40_12390 [Trichormus sp. M33_DOE_039]|nr:hypothetical protein [Trichormus sp. M33_DOE_039]